MKLLRLNSLIDNSKNLDRFFFLYILFFLVYVFYYLFQLPIYAGDTDLWYHLNSGRYILEHKTIPKDSSFFSFIEPPREWVDYYWLFQVLVYKIFTFSGYYGLVFLRAFVFLALVFTFYFFLNEKVTSSQNLFNVIIFSLLIMFFIPRFQLIRPHIFTYLLIMVFIYILESKPKHIFILPVLALMWVNLHGIVYPLMIIIVMAYLIDFFIGKVRNKKHIERHELPYVLTLVIICAIVFFTPHGTNLTWVPFVPTDFASLYIIEIAKIKIEELFSFQIVRMTFTFVTLFNILLYLSCLAFIIKILSKKIKLCHFILFLSGILLLTKANRFRFECVLLMLPLLKDFISNVSVYEAKQKKLKAIGLIFATLFMIMSFLTIKETFAYIPKKFPFSQRNLPEGVSTFLNKINAQGRVFNHPNHGGYLQWILYPKYKIFMDMEIPFLFLNEDIFTANNTYTTQTGLDYIVNKYRPQFIIAPIGNHLFKNLIQKHPAYKIVFFDETSVLYGDNNAFPEIVESYALRELDPYTINYLNLDKIISEKKDQVVLNELLRLNNIYPHCSITNQIIALIYQKTKKYSEGKKYAENIISQYPESYLGYKLKGDILQAMGDYTHALFNYNIALNKTQNKVEIYKEMGNVYMKEKKYDKAYKVFKAITDPFSLKDYKFFYDVCLAAYLSGNVEDAKILFNYAYSLVPKEDKEWNEKYLKFLVNLTLKD